MILALDLATQTGVAVGDSAGKPTASTHKLGPGDHAARFLGGALMVKRLIAEHQPDAIAIEEPYLDMKHPDAARFLYGLRGAVLLSAKSQGYDVHEINIRAIRSHFIGRHKKGLAKVSTIEQCRRLGWAVANDDEADACAVWETMRARLKLSALMPAGGMF